MTLVAGASLNCGASLLFESPAIYSSPELFRFCQLLLSSSWLHLLSSHPTISEFFESRAQLYEHDRLRYPMYFGKVPLLTAKTKIVSKGSSATQSLSKSLAAWGQDTERANAQERDAKKVVLESLVRREDRAVTAAIFVAASAASTQPNRAIGLVRRRISTDYSDHFKEALGSDIVTGMPGLDYFDFLSLRFPCYDIVILQHFSHLLGLRGLIESGWESNQAFWERFLHTGSSDPAFQAYLEQASIIFYTLFMLYKRELSPNIHSFRIKITQALCQLKSNFSSDNIRPDQDVFYNMLLRTQNITSHLENNSGFKDVTAQVRTERQMLKPCDVLILVATDIEQTAVIEKFGSVGNRTTLHFDGGRAFYDLGYLNRRRIALVKAEMGSSSVGGSTTTTMRMVNQLSPGCIIMVGIAFGVNPSKQKIGDVLISKQVLCYDLQRIGTDAHGEPTLKNRGDKIRS